MLPGSGILGALISPSNQVHNFKNLHNFFPLWVKQGELLSHFLSLYLHRLYESTFGGVWLALHFENEIRSPPRSTRAVPYVNDTAPL